MFTFDIQAEKRPIIKTDFTGKSDVSSHLFQVDLDHKVVDCFEDIFGLHDIHLDSGYKIDKE